VQNTAGNYEYYVIVSQSGSGCDPVYSNPSSINVLNDVSLIISPSTQSICVNGELSPIVVSSNGGIGSQSYQWYYTTNGANSGGTLISGATNSTYTPSVSSPFVRFYYCSVNYSASGCSLNSSASQVTVSSLPSFSVQPMGSQTICLDGIASVLSVTTINGSGQPTYQWYRNTVNSTSGGTAISGATSSTYQPLTSVIGTSYYYCVATFSSSNCGSVTSTVSTVNVVSDPVISVQPSSVQTICVGGTSPSLSVSASGGTGTFSYQWYNGITAQPISGATSATYSPGSFSSPVENLYYVSISQSGSGCNTLTSGISALSVISDPVASVDPMLQGICVGGTLNSMSASYTGGSGSPSYQWYYNTSGSNTSGTVISGATNSSYAPATGSSLNRYYYCVITLSSSGCSVNSAASQVIISASPTFSTQPISSQTVCMDGTPAPLTVAMSGGSGTPSFQWYSNTSNSVTGGVAIAGATSASYIPLANVTGTKYYYCIASYSASNCGAITSSVASVAVVADPIISAQPTSSQSICVGGSASMSVTASGGTGTFTYQWYNGASNLPISGATSSSYNTGTISTVVDNSYYVIVSQSGSGCNNVTSNNSLVTVLADPAATVSPTSQGICTSGVLTPITVSYTGGTGSTSYQWYYTTSGSNTGGTIVSGGTNSTYTPSVTSTFNRYYYCVVTLGGSGCSVNSPTSQVTIATAPSFSTQPTTSQTVCLNGTPGALNVMTSNGYGTPTYQWYSNTTNSTNGSTLISGANGSSYVPTTATVGVVYYYCVASYTSSNCNSITSNIASVTVVSDPSITSQPTSNQSICVGGTPSALTVSATGGTGSFTYQWYNATTLAAITGATNSSYSPGVQNTAGNYEYYVIVSQSGSGCDSRVSDTAQVLVNSDPIINAQPISTGYCQGGVIQPLTVSVDNYYGTTTYTWYSNTSNSTSGGSVIANSNNSSYTPTTSSIGTKYYYCNITSTVSGCSIGNSAIAQISIASQPSINTQPLVSQIICSGGSTNLTVTYTNGAGVPNYQWYSNNSYSTVGSTPILNSNANALSQILSSNGDTYYYCVISFGSNGCNPMTSNIGTVNVISDPSISTSLLSDTVCVGGSISSPFSCSYSGGIGAPNYQWYFNSTNNNSGGTAIAGAINSSYNPGVISQVGIYYYYMGLTLAGSGCGPVFSPVVQINTMSDPIISGQPISTQTVCQNSNSQILQVTLNSNSLPYTYQWYSNSSNSTTGGTLINGATNNTYSPSTSSTGSLYYYCNVSQSFNGCSTLTSIGRVNVNANAVITSQPITNQSICLGGTLSNLSVSVSGGVGSAQYQWHLSNSNGANGIPISGANSSSYLPQSNSIGSSYYYCQITFGSGNCGILVSNISAVSIYSQPTITTQPIENVQICQGGSGNLSVSSSTAGGTMSVQWYNQSTNSPISGATNANFTTPLLSTLGQTNYYYAIVSWSGSGCTSVTSSVGSVVVINQPIADVSPVTQTICQDISANPITSSIQGGSGNSTYQWYYSLNGSNSGGVLIPGATNSSYTPSYNNPDDLVNYSIGSGSSLSGNSGSDPIDGYAASFRYQVIYTQAELQLAGILPNMSIRKLGWSIDTDFGNGNLNNYTIKLGTTSNTNSASHDNSATTTVYSGTYDPTYTAVGQFDLISLTTGFLYTGGNLLVDVCSSGNTANTTSAGSVRTIATSTSNGSRYVRGTAGQCALTTSNINSTKPQIQFAVSMGNQLYYYCTISQTSNCSAVSPVSLVSINSVPYISSQSMASQTICTGGALTPLNVIVSNASGFSITYQWYSNSINSTSSGIAITGATSSTYTPANNIVGTKYYYLKMTIAGLTNCNILYSNVASVVVESDPVITTQPVSQNTCVGNTGSVQLSSAFNSNPQLGSSAVQWNLNGSPISGANQVTYSPNITTAGSYSYSMSVTQSLYSGCSATSNSATIIVYSDPVVTSVGSTNYSVCLNQPAPVLTVSVAGGNGIAGYQWYLNTISSNSGGTAISGATSASYQPSSLSIGVFYYYCLISQATLNCSGSSTVFTVSVSTAPANVDNSISSNLDLCQGGSSTALTVGNGSSYLWYQNASNSYIGASSTGVTTASYSPNVDLSGNSYYFCLITLPAGSGCTSLYSNISSVIVSPSPVITQQPLSQSGCQNFTPNALTVAISGSYNFQWYKSFTNSNTNGILLNGATSNSYTPPTNQFGTIFYYCVIYDILTGCQTISDVAYVFVRFNPNVAIPSGDINVCLGGSAQFLATGASTYVWSNSVQNGYVFPNVDAGTYTVTGTDQYGCVNTSSFTISIVDLPIIFAGEDINICPGVAVSLHAVGGISYSWNNGVIQNQTFYPVTGIYSVAGTDANGCTGYDDLYIQVSANNNPTILAEVFPTVYGLDGYIDLTVSGLNPPYNYIWNELSGIGDTLFTEDIYNLAVGTYQVEVRDGLGCKVIGEYTIAEGHELFIPTGLSPNGDGYNDTWEIKGLSQFDDFEISVYNSNGFLVYFNHNSFEPWDGISSFGLPLTSDDYVYIIKTKSPEIQKTGFLTIVY
jgi:gliding motility-associated-like protein